MSLDPFDPLFRAYVNELACLRGAGADFARSHPKLARRLELARDGAADPQIERLIESFAFLAARIQREIEADFPLIPAALLGTLYPHLTAPVPSMAIARFDTDPAHSRATMGIAVPRATPLYASAEDGLTCRFRTSAPVTLWPVEVAGLDLLSPFALTAVAGEAERLGAAALLRLRLTCQGNRDFAEFTPNRLRLFLDADPTTAETLYELLGHRVGGVLVLPDGAERARRSRIRVEPVGFGPDEALLPHPDTAHQGYRLLQEYFLFPEKFLFVDLVDLPPLGPGRVVDLVFLLTRRPPGGLILRPDTLRLGCTPIINLFPRTSEPIRLDHTQVEYRLMPDIRWERATEIHSILKVSDTAAANAPDRAVLPFFSTGHPSTRGERDCYWIARRQPTGRPDLPGSEMLLSFKDLGLDPALPSSPVLFAHTLCTNRGAAEQIAPGTALTMERAAPVAAIVCHTRPTAQLAAPEDGETLWQLVSHLSLNHLSLAGGADSLEGLKEILRLYGGRQAGHGQQLIDALTALATRRVVRRIGADAWRGFCRGTEVTLTVDDRTLGSALYLFTGVLSHFLGLYCGVNLFTELRVTTPRQEGAWITWPPRTGEAIVL
ncbi:type VI secretion system baseplate subunit TssF [Phaeospirillum tilakii]|uniref:Type VI secretion system baseplate subunit TssF n=1 Tax=Phaeospirillum tilakii TaxID=741673 RepID=A0ABW5CAN5_9PROT